MIPITFLDFNLVKAFSAAKGLINLITKGLVIINPSVARGVGGEPTHKIFPP